MRHFRLIWLAVAMLTVGLAAQGVTGVFQGGLRMRGEYMALELRLKEVDGVVSGELDLLQRGIAGCPVTDARAERPRVELTFALPGGERRGRFEGELDGDLLTGKFALRTPCGARGPVPDDPHDRGRP